ncbi:phosphatidylinositol glycan, class A [Fistulifera solaris]|uniref:phosphatidylinositol N-acetylglucosaminyltransferase n=1 Tax=Fistulifera solaris TaxID=1519565 RepID=A0A1Z5J6J0_FISSO|nr:phosphatidylinositol glycan, class A [Fistulifera solaris]|eukprot:GAX09600.1 phosphatidylinositol glycan, class A [Fistulifera solaris]
MPRIAMVCDFFYPRIGGVENHIYSLSLNLIRLGHKVIIITHAYGNRKGVRYLPGPLKVYYCPILPMTDQDAMPTFIATFPLLRHIFIRERIDIVHAHQATSTMANESIVYAAALRIASVYTDHSLFGFDDLASTILNRVLQTTLSTVDAAIGVSHVCHDNLILRARLDPNRVFVIPNAVDPSKFSPDPSQRRRDRLVYRKGIDLLVGIIPKVCSELKHVHFLVGGDGPKLLDLQEMVERDRLQDRVEFLGSVPHANVRNVLVRGDIFLNCSLTESFCIAILEAACCGLLVVSTNVGGVPEVLPDDMIMLSDPTVESMVTCVREAVQADRTDAVAHIQHQRIRDVYTWERVAEETILVYKKVLCQHRRGFLERMSCYQSLNGITGFVVCCLALIVEIWVRIVEWWQPIHQIDRVPDLSTRVQSNGVQHLN